jgi:hypothetical protein
MQSLALTSVEVERLEQTLQLLLAVQPSLQLVEEQVLGLNLLQFPMVGAGGGVQQWNQDILLVVQPLKPVVLAKM